MATSSLRFLLAALFMAGVLATAPTASRAAALSADDLANVERALGYLNSISTLRARFVQVSSNGAYAEGEVLIDRPGKLRFDYDPPVPVLLIANGLSLLFYDRELKEASFLPLWETPLWFLIREEVELSGDMRVEKVTQCHTDQRYESVTCCSHISSRWCIENFPSFSILHMIC